MSKLVPDTKAELKRLASEAIEAYEAIEDAEARLAKAIDKVAEVICELDWTSLTYQGYWIGWDILENGDLEGPSIRRTKTVNLDSL